jgi:WD40 repeat protein
MVKQLGILLLLFFVLLNKIQAQKTSLTIPTGHLSTPKKIAVSPNGNWLASVDDKHLIIWNAFTGAQIRNYDLKRNVESISWFPDNNRLAVMTNNYPVDSLFKINITTGLREGKSTAVKEAYRMKVSQNGKYYLVSEIEGRIFVIDAESNEVLQKILPDTKKLNLTIFTTPDEKYCAALDFKNLSVTTFEPGVGEANKKSKELFKTKFPFGELRRHSFSPDSKYLITLVGPDFGIVCFDVQTGAVKWSVKSPSSFDDFGYTADGKNIIVLHEGLIETYALATGVKVGLTIKLPQGLGTDMIVSGGMAYLWNSWNEEYKITRYNALTGLSDMAFTSDFQQGNYADLSFSGKIFTQGSSKSPLRIWNFEEGRVIQSFPIATKYQNFKLSPDGSTVVYGKLQVANTKTGLLKYNLPYDDFYEPDFIKISNSEKRIATKEPNEGSLDGVSMLNMYNTVSRTKLWKAKLPPISSMAFSADEQLLAVAFLNGNIAFYNTENGTIVFSFKPSEKKPAFGISFINSASVVVSIDDKILQYEVSTGSLQRTIYNANTPINVFELADDGKKAIIRTSNAVSPISVIDLVEGKLISNIKGHFGQTFFTGILNSGKQLVSTGSDDKTILWDVLTGQKIAELYAFNNEWLVVTPDGRFDGTTTAINKLYYTKGTEVLPLQNLYEKYYTPRLLNRLLAGEQLEVVINIDDLKPAPTVAMAYKSETRNLIVSDDIASYLNTTGNAEITVTAKASSDVVTDIRLFHNGKIITLNNRNLIVTDDKQTESLTRSYRIALLPGENLFKAIALNSQRTESNAALMAVSYNKPQDDQTGAIANNTIYEANVAEVDRNATLHLVVIGINKYQNQSLSLNYALADANAFKNEVEKDAKTILANVKTYFVSDDLANKKGITDAFNEVKKNALPQDIFVFYYAGHGVISPKTKEFYLVPTDITDLKNEGQLLIDKGISASLLQGFASDIQAQKQVFILDACQSAGAFEQLITADANQQKNIALLARSTGTHWLAASGAQQFANEFAELGHGAFTYVLLQALKGQAANNKMITVNGLKNFMQLQVPALMKKYSGTSQMPASYGFGNDFPVEVIK